jgi:RHS repeat-associated protein
VRRPASAPSAEGFGRGDHLAGTELITSGTIPTDKLYTGQQRETTNGIYYYGSRFYNADIGRFLQPDSIVPEPGNPQALNRYSYVLNNPLRYSDPTGHCHKELGWDQICGVHAHQGGSGPMIPQSAPSAANESSAGFAAEWGYGIMSQSGGPGSYELDVIMQCFVRMACGPYGQSQYGEFLFPLILGEAVTPWPEEWLTPALIAALITAGLMAGDVDVTTDSTTLSQGPIPVYVVRGGLAEAPTLVAAAERDIGISVNSAPGASIEELSVGLPHPMISYTTVWQLQEIGYTVVPDPLPGSPYHALILTPTGLTTEQANIMSSVFTRQPNPWRKD